MRVVPSGSCVVWKEMGVNSPEEAGLLVANAMLCEEPQAILVMR